MGLLAHQDQFQCALFNFGGLVAQGAGLSMSLWISVLIALFVCSGFLSHSSTISFAIKSDQIFPTSVVTCTVMGFRSSHKQPFPCRYIMGIPHYDIADTALIWDAKLHPIILNQSLQLVIGSQIRRQKYGLFTLRKPCSPLRISGKRGFLRVNK